MKTISIRELHDQTEDWVRQAAQYGQIIVTDRGVGVATIQPLSAAPAENPFRNRRLLPDYAAALSRLGAGTDSTQIVSEMRDR